MKNYKVIATRCFRDSNEIDEKTGLKVERKINDIFYCTKERYEYLKENNAVKLVEVIEEKEEIVEDYDNVDFEIEQEWREEEKKYEEPQKDEVVEKIINKKKKRSKK